MLRSKNLQCIVHPDILLIFDYTVEAKGEVQRWKVSERGRQIKERKRAECGERRERREKREETRGLERRVRKVREQRKKKRVPTRGGG